MQINLKKQTQRQALNKLFEILNSFSPPTKQLSPSERNVLSEFLLLPQKFTYSPFSSPARKLVSKRYNQHYQRSIKTKTLSSYVQAYLNKKYITRDDDNILYFAPHIKKAATEIIQSLEKGETYTITINIEPDQAKIIETFVQGDSPAN